MIEKFSSVTPLTDIALEFAEKAHAGQYRHDGKTPYIIHPREVVRITRELMYANRHIFIDSAVLVKTNYKTTYDEAGAIAALHDVLEDTQYILEDLRKIGMTPRVIKGVLLLTKLPDMEYLDYILNIKHSLPLDLGKYVKIADLTHNLSDLKKGSLRDKYMMAKWILGA